MYLVESEYGQTLKLNEELIALDSQGEEFIDLYNQCSIVTTTYDGVCFTLKLVKVIEGGELPCWTTIELRYMEAKLLELRIDNDLNDYTSVQSLKLLKAAERNVIEITLQI